MANPWIVAGLAKLSIAYGMVGRAAQLAGFLGMMGFTQLKIAAMSIPWIASAMTMLSGAIMAVGRSAMFASALAMVTSPIGLIVLGAVALAGAGYLVYRAWTAASNFIYDTFYYLLDLFQGVVDFLNGAWSGLGTVLAAPFVTVGYLVRQIFYNLGDFLYSLITLNLYGVGRAIINTIGAGIISVGSFLVDVVWGVFQMVRALLPFSPAKEGPFSDLDVSGQRIILTLVDGVLSVGKVLYDAIKGLFGAVWNLLTSFNLTSIGTGLISSLISGITGMASGVAEAVSTAVSGAVESARKNIPGYDSAINVTSNLIGGVLGESKAPDVTGVSYFKKPFIAKNSPSATPMPTQAIQGQQSGQAMVTTVSDGMKQETPTILSTIGQITQSVAEYLPFSDAKIGAFSRLTYSGGMIPGTLAQGVEKGSPVLINSVEASTKLASETIESNISNTPNVATPTVSPVAVQSPVLPDLQTSVEMPYLTAPQPVFTNFKTGNVANQQITTTDSTKLVTRQIEESLATTQKSSKIVDTGK